MRNRKIIMSEQDIPRKWYNIQPDLPRPLDPPLHPATNQPLGPDDLAPLFPMALIGQEVSQERWIDIPDEVLDIYSMWRPTPLYRAFGLEKELQTPAKIYYKYEGVSPAGSHKPNTAVAQAYYNKQENVKRISTETGAGQWGSALSFACQHFGIECMVYMVRISFEQKPYRKSMINAWGASVVPSPSNLTAAGRAILEKDPNSTGSLGIAISEAVEDAASREDTKYSLGSVLNHVVLHQTIIGLECQKQFEQTSDYPDVVIGCHGGGSNFAGLTFPFVKEKLDGKRNIKFVAAEPASCPSLTGGKYEYDFGDVAGLAPSVKMYTLGHDFVPEPIHAGGLRYHGASPLVSLLVHEGVIGAAAYDQLSIFKSAVMFARTEGIIPAPESSHAIHGAIVEALECKKTGEAKTILFGLSGHGHLDLAAYDAYLSGAIK
ncbi:MAG TPA: TrpB-like pyridoxal phosphate-dependent enzyme [bacterium]|nr:TrpB-like pyridoxal phosphate-dependent enzyme [bacterium]